MSAARLLQAALKDGRHTLLEPEALELCRLFGIPISEWRFAESAEDAARLAKEIGFPVVMKVVTSKLMHKMESGGVLLGLRNSKEVKSRFKTLVEAVSSVEQSPVLGVLLQEQADPGLEVIVGAFHDPQFGACMMFGLGGVLAELVPEATFRLIPLSEEDAGSMLAEVAGGKLLTGFRGYELINTDALVKVILNVARMMSELRALDSVELNPIVLRRDKAVVVDAKASLMKMRSR